MRASRVPTFARAEPRGELRWTSPPSLAGNSTSFRLRSALRRAGGCRALLMGRETASREQRRRTPVGTALPGSDESFELEHRQQSGSFVPGYVEQARGL